MESLFTEKEVSLIGDLAYDFKFLDYCQDDEELSCLDEIKRAAYGCTSMFEYLRSKEHTYKDFDKLIHVRHLVLLRRCLEEVDFDNFKEADSVKKIYKKICAVTPIPQPKFNKEEFLKLHRLIESLQLEVEKLGCVNKLMYKDIEELKERIENITKP
jgi:hypothetical protein